MIPLVAVLTPDLSELGLASRLLSQYDLVIDLTIYSEREWA